MPLPDHRPFGGSVLHAILAEFALTGDDQRFDLVRRPAFGNGDQRDVAGLAPRNLAGSGNGRANFT
jgi:hypothetical protein